MMKSYIKKNDCDQIRRAIQECLIYKQIFEINDFIQLMLNQTTIDKNAQNRRSQKPAISLQNIHCKIKPKSYETLVEWLVDDNFIVPFPYFSQINQSANVLKVSRETKYLTRVYLDLVLESCLQFGEKDYICVSLVCLSLAIKFKESVEVRQTFTPQYIFQLAQLPYSRECYYAFETQILLVLKFKLQFTTPYDYIDIFYERFPWNASFKNALADILDLVILLPFCVSYSSEELFFGTVQTILREKRLNLSLTQKSVLAGMTDTWAKASQLSVLILAEIRQFLE